jgi:hypothetical protein
MSKENIKQFIYNEVLYATVMNILNVPSGLNFYTEDKNFIQVGTWNYKKNTLLDLHYHLEFPRVAYKTNESVYVVKGRINCSLFTEDGEFLTEIEINENEMITQFNGAHEYKILEDTIAIEIKNGPYFGPEKDRVRIEKQQN